MKFVFVFLLAGVAFANSPNLENTQTFKETQEEVKVLDIEKKAPSRRELQRNQKYFKEDPTYKTTYVTFGGVGVPIKNNYVVAPAISGGWLFREDKKGVDVSLSTAYLYKKPIRVFALTLPKVQYLAFLRDVKSSAKHSGYFGIGGSFHNMFVAKKEKTTEVDEDSDATYTYNREKAVSAYSGLAANASLGYNYKLGDKLQSYVQLGANMPTPLSIYSKGDIYKPSFELNLGLGF